MSVDSDVLIIGAGPAGTVAAALLADAGHRVHLVEKQHFPRFAIGESLLPQCMEYLERAGLLEAVQAAGFQRKDGAAFAWGERRAQFEFADKFSAGWSHTYQVERDRFDALLADQVRERGVPIEFGTAVTGFHPGNNGVLATLTDEHGGERPFRARFALDASGFGRVLPRLLGLEKSSGFAARRALFTHIDDGIDDPRFDRDKILITVHQEDPRAWFWLIPFPGGRASLGLVAPDDFFAGLPEDNDAALDTAVAGETGLRHLLGRARRRFPTRRNTGFAAAVTANHGPGYALLGNAADFLDPVFSSGVTIAMHSAVLAADTLDRQLRGLAADWQSDFAEPLAVGVDTFRHYVRGWYDGRFRTVVFHPDPPAEIKAMVCSILAGYAWDRDNPYVQQPKRRLAALAELCALQSS